MPRFPRQLPQGYSFHITLRCNSRQFLIAKGLRRDVLLAVLAKAQAKVPHRLYAGVSDGKSPAPAIAPR
jgi:putative transposase